MYNLKTLNTQNPGTQIPASRTPGPMLPGSQIPGSRTPGSRIPGAQILDHYRDSYPQRRRAENGGQTHMQKWYLPRSHITMTHAALNKSLTKIQIQIPGARIQDPGARSQDPGSRIEDRRIERTLTRRAPSFAGQRT